MSLSDNTPEIPVSIDEVASAVAKPELDDSHKNKLKMAFATLGVVYGDIGTSPLYAMREALHPIKVFSPKLLILEYYLIQLVTILI